MKNVKRKVTPTPAWWDKGGITDGMEVHDPRVQCQRENEGIPWNHQKTLSGEAKISMT